MAMFDMRLFHGFAFGTQFVEFFDFAFEMTLQARLLQSEIAERLRIFMLDGAFDGEIAVVRVNYFRAEAFFEFEAAVEEDGGFENGNAQELPLGVGDFLDGGFFEVGGGVVVAGDGGYDFLVGDGVFVFHDDGAAGEAVLQSVHFGDVAALGRNGPMTEFPFSREALICSSEAMIGSFLR